MKKNIFTPKSIAVIGASPKKKKIGFQVLKNIIDGGYKGRIYPINIDSDIKDILGKKSYTSVLNVPGKIDLAVFVIPAAFVAKTLIECGKKKIKSAVIITAGFKEIGLEGETKEKEIIEIAKKYKISILGPNCLGFIDTSIKLNATFAQAIPKKGHVSLISQSGAVCTAVLDWAIKNNIGFSKIFSIGNKANITELDLIPYLANDPETETIIIYLEDVVNNSQGKNFLEIAQKETLKKPIIILKAGTSKKGIAAASSHTGALSSSDEAISALFKQSGVIRANSLEDLFDWTEAFSLAKKPKGNRVVVITNAGGPGVMTIDAIENSRLVLATLEKETTRKLKEVLPPTANVNNPIDVIGDADAERYKKALTLIEKDRNVDAIITLLAPQSSTQVEETARLILSKIKSSPKTIIPVFMGGKRVNKGINIFEKNSSVIFEYPERGVMALEKISYCQSCEMGIKKIYPPRILKIEKSKKNKVDRIVGAIGSVAQKKSSTLISGPIADEILRQYQIPVVKSKTVLKKVEAISITKKIGFPVVMKINSPDIAHKSDVGGVIVGIKNEKEAGSAFEKIIANAKKNAPRAKINGVDIYEMIPDGVEFFIGAKRDPIYGPLIGFGLGGIYIEVLKDISFRLAPLSEFDIEKMIGELKTNKIISGTRGKSALNKKGIVDALIKVSNLMINHPEIQELDINPIKVFEDRVVALDSRIIIN